MRKAILAVCVGLTLAAVAGPASARMYHHRQAELASQGHINSGFGPPMNWNEIEISMPSGGN